MNYTATKTNNVSTTDRGVRIVIGVSLIAGLMMQTGPLGLTALLLIAAIYPLMTGFLGWDPVYTVATRGKTSTPVQPAHAAVA